MNDDSFRLNPALFPQRIDLDLSPDLLQRLERIAERSGRSVKDIAADLLSQAIGDNSCVEGS